MHASSPALVIESSASISNTNQAFVGVSLTGHGLTVFRDANLVHSEFRSHVLALGKAQSGAEWYGSTR